LKPNVFDLILFCAIILLWRREIAKLLKQLKNRIFPPPIHGVFHTQEIDKNGVKIVRRYVDGYLSSKKVMDEHGGYVTTGPGSPLSPAECALPHGDHADIFKRLRLKGE